MIHEAFVTLCLCGDQFATNYHKNTKAQRKFVSDISMQSNPHDSAKSYFQADSNPIFLIPVELLPVLVLMHPIVFVHLHQALEVLTGDAMYRTLINIIAFGLDVLR